MVPARTTTRRGGLPAEHRGQRFDGQLEELRRIWSGEKRGTVGPIADAIAADALTGAEDVRAYLVAQEMAGCDELIFFPCSVELEEVDRFADAVGF